MQWETRSLASGQEQAVGSAVHANASIQEIKLSDRGQHRLGVQLSVEDDNSVPVVAQIVDHRRRIPEAGLVQVAKVRGVAYQRLAGSDGEAWILRQGGSTQSANFVRDGLAGHEVL